MVYGAGGIISLRLMIHRRYASASRLLRCLSEDRANARAVAVLQGEGNGSPEFPQPYGLRSLSLVLAYGLRFQLAGRASPVNRRLVANCQDHDSIRIVVCILYNDFAFFDFCGLTHRGHTTQQFLRGVEYMVTRRTTGP